MRFDPNASDHHMEICGAHDMCVCTKKAEVQQRVAVTVKEKVMILIIIIIAACPACSWLRADVRSLTIEGL